MATDPGAEGLRVLYERILTGWNDRNAQAMASAFADDGNMIGFDGSQADSRSAIEAHLRPIFLDHPTAAYVAKIREVRMLDATVGILRAVAGMIPPASNDLNPSVNTIHTLVGVSRDKGEWRAALFQSTPAAWHGRPHDAARLTDELRAVMRAGLIVEGGRP